MRLQTTMFKSRLPAPLKETGHNFGSRVLSSTKSGKRLPLYYLLVTAIVAMAGYYFILLFPILFVASIYNAYILLLVHSSGDSIPTLALLWITLSILFGHISYNILTINFTSIPGVKIGRKSADPLYKLLEDVQQQYPRGKIKQIIVSEHFELTLVKVPFFGVPVFRRNVLVVGLPLMLTLSASQFNCLYTRKIIQCSNSRLLNITWLNQLRDTWSRYLTLTKPNSCIGHQILYWFFRVYSPVYNAVSLTVRLTDELNADRNALDLVNSDELISAFQANLRGNIYLLKDFWPWIQNTANSRHSGIRPFSMLSRLAKTVLLQNKSNDWLRQSYISEECARRQLPTLTQRMDNLGLSAITLPPDLKQSAAEYFFQNHFAKIIALTDDNWGIQERSTEPNRSAPAPNRLLGYREKKT